jgi:hypothetical protein
MRAAVSLLLSALLVGCGLLAPVPPDWVANRNPLPSCGRFAEGDPQELAAQRCLLDAYREGRGAELITTSTRPTGHLMTSYVRVHENGTIEMFHDMGIGWSEPGAWERFRCEALVPSSEGVQAQPPVADRFMYTLEGCEQLPVP